MKGKMNFNRSEARGNYPSGNSGSGPKDLRFRLIYV